MANEQISEITTVPTNATVIKIINTLIKRYNSLGSIYTFKGSVQTYAELLAIENPNVGDVYNVVQEDEEHQIAAGSNFVWDGTVWDNLGGSLAGLVQSVNGVNPDSLGNVLLPLIKNITTNQGVLTITKNDNSTEQFNNIKKLYMLTLGENVDLNNIKESGVYICINNDYAANYENCPIQKAFLLEVQTSDNGNFVYQFLTQYNDGSTEAGNQYTRTYYNNWSAWRTAGSGSNLTTYTSLEQLGITPGEETFASIHSALPINSALEYFVTPALTTSDIYPATTGLFRVFKSFNSTNVLICEFYTIFSNESKQYAQLWSTLYNSSYPNSTIEWNRHHNVSVDGTLPAIASKTEAEAGTDNTKFMTPLRVAQAIDALDGNPIISASISGKIITLTKKDGSEITLKTQDTIGITANSSHNATKGYTQLSDKTLFQYYKGGTGTQTFTWAKPFANNNYVVVSGDKCDNNASENIRIKSQTTTTVTVQTVSWVTAWVFAFGKGV